MTAERAHYGSHNGEVTFVCDDCGESFYSGLSNFKDAVAALKQEGWVLRRVNSAWEHYCERCK